MFSAPITGQNKVNFLKNWEAHPVPTYRDTIYKYGHSINDWFVYLDKNEIMVDDINPLCHPSCRKKVYINGIHFLKL